jgi:hypothetical protein
MAWIAVARLILIPNGMPAPVGWVAAMFAALLACVQALCWSPFGLPYLRPIVGLLLLSALVAGGEMAAVDGASSAALIRIYVALVALAYTAAVVGLAAARRGDGAGWPSLPQPTKAVDKALPRRQRPFASPAAAQLWFEWRRNGAALPLFVAGIGLLLTLPVAWVHELRPIGTGGGLPLPPFHDVEMNVWLALQKGALLWPVLLAGIIGCGLRKYDSRRKDLSLHPFFATRPLITSALVLAKLQMAALSTLAAWGIMLLFVWGWLLTPAREGERNGPLVMLLLAHCTPSGLVLALCGVVAMIGWTWKNQVQGLFVELTGRRWVTQGVPAAVYGLMLAAFIALVHWSSSDRGVELQRYDVPRLVGWLMGLAVTLKLGVVGWALHALRRRALVSERALAGVVTAWLVLVTVLFGLFSWAAREANLAWLPMPAGHLLSAPYLLAAAVLCAPITRLALAPLALAWNRHR